MNGLHPCTLPQRAPFAAVRRVSPLCAAFRAGCECVRDSTAKAHVAPTCGQRRKMRIQYADPTQRSPAAAGKILPFGRSQHRIWLVAGVPASCQMLFAGRSPHPLQWKRRKHEKGQTIQHSDFRTGFGHDTPKSSTSPYEPERLCDCLLSWKTYCDSERAKGSPAAAKSHRQQP